jgi:hypothetical protein
MDYVRRFHQWMPENVKAGVCGGNFKQIVAAEAVVYKYGPSFPKKVEPGELLFDK